MGFIDIECSQRRCHCYVVARKHTMAVDNTGFIPTRAGSRGTDGTRTDGKSSHLPSMPFTRSNNITLRSVQLTVEEYVHAMETLVNDFRFTLYNACYKRVLLIWVIFAFCVLMGLLFSGLKGIALFSLGVAWLFLNAAAIFMCMWIKLRLARGLERCLASVNKQLLRHKIVVALDDRGRISCHKVNLCFMYYDPEQCVNYLNEFIERSEQNGRMIEAGWESRLDVDVNDIVIQGSQTTRVSRRKVSWSFVRDHSFCICVCLTHVACCYHVLIKIVLSWWQIISSFFLLYLVRNSFSVWPVKLCICF